MNKKVTSYQQLGLFIVVHDICGPDFLPSLSSLLSFSTVSPYRSPFYSLDFWPLIVPSPDVAFLVVMGESGSVD